MDSNYSLELYECTIGLVVYRWDRHYPEVNQGVKKIGHVVGFSESYLLPPIPMVLVKWHNSEVVEKLNHTDLINAVKWETL